MKKTIFPKLALNNIKLNKRTYIPYLLTCIVTVAMYYIIHSLSLNPGMEEMFGGNSITLILQLGCAVIAFFAVIFLFYTNSFLVKRRKKEFAIFNILGMEKRHLSAVLAWETLYVMLMSLTAGLAIGILLDKIMFLLIGKLINAAIVLGFFIAPKALLDTMALFALIFLLIFANAVRQIHIAQPMELLRDSSAGEKEPKTKWLMTVLGMICIACGYYLAITVDNPVQSVFTFFYAVILVVLGTYFLFTAGSIAFLKLMRKNKKYYYQTRHFISVSGMIYRMKQNAVGLANICILSTMVLIMLSSTSSLMIGLEDILTARHPFDFSVYSYEKDEKQSEALFEDIHQIQKAYGMTTKNEIQYTYLAFEAYQDGNTFYTDRHVSPSMLDSLTEILVLTLPDYNTMEGESRTLREGEIFVCGNRSTYENPVLKLLGREYQVAGQLDHFIKNGRTDANIVQTLCMIVANKNELDWIYQQQKEIFGDICSNITKYHGFDSNANERVQNDFYQAVVTHIQEHYPRSTFESRAMSRNDFYGLYGGLFFIGIFLAVLFVMATVLIIYYKQISEGYDDKTRFAIMQKVGMRRSEVKAAIRSQVLTVFFLPLLVAGIHVAAAFPLISKLLALLNCMNTQLYIMCTVVSFCAFSIMYVAIYLLTARTYYRIVSR